MRLIDADELECITYHGTEGWPDTFDDGVLWVLDKIDNLPSIDAVPVVRCDECWFRPKGKTYCTELERHTGDGFYCAFGQRREEEHNAAD